MNSRLFRTVVLSSCTALAGALAACTSPAANTSLLPVPCPTDVFCVDDDAPPGGDGTTWDHAFRTVQEAVDAAVSGQQVWVAAGTYLPSAANLPVLTMKDGVSVYGGFAGSETQLSERPDPVLETVLTGDFLGNDPPDFQVEDRTPFDDNSQNVVTASSNVTLDGVTVREPAFFYPGIEIYSCTNVTVSNSLITENTLSGINVWDSDVLVRNVVIDRNVSLFGGGIGIDASVPHTKILQVEGSVFTNNIGASDSGGAIAVYNADLRIAGSLFYHNDSCETTDVGTRFSKVMISNSWFGGNAVPVNLNCVGKYASINLYGNDAADDAVIKDSVFTGRTGGLAIILEGRSHNVLLSGIDVYGNSDTDVPGAILHSSITGIIGGSDAALTIINSSFHDNDLGQDSSSLMIEAITSARILNSSFYRNTSRSCLIDLRYTYDPGVVENSAFWGNTTSSDPGNSNLCVDDYYGPNFTVTHSCADEALTGTGNVLLSANPFVQAASGELYLDPASPCADAGSTAAGDDATTGYPAVGLDWRNLTTRLDGTTDTGTVDMGRHYDPAAVVVLTLTIDATTASWTTRNATGCSLTNDQNSTVYDVPAGDLGSGSTTHGFGSGAKFTLICTGDPYPAAASATVP